jgi:hypothetical protein
LNIRRGRQQNDVSASKARELLGVLLDRVESVTDRMRLPSERAPGDFSSASARVAFTNVLGDAERKGAISVVKGRGEARHLIERIRLKDATRLYEFLGRVPANELAKEAARRLHLEAAARHPEATRARDVITGAWLRGERPFGLNLNRISHAVEFIVALDAALARDPLDRRDLRTYSGQVTGDTKLLERHASRIVAFLKQAGRLDAALTDDEAMASLGLEKFPQPVLISGPLHLTGTDLSGLVYVGIPPEQASQIEPTSAIRSVLTIENLASFNRHVRETRVAGDVVVYTGGFPSRAVTAALVAVSQWPGIVCIHHWGDVDEGGLRIALHLSSRLTIPVVPHLMTPELAQQRGTPAKMARHYDLPLDHPWHPLAAFLESEGARFLEQETLDPTRVQASNGESSPAGEAAVLS